jgi:simple sugar transport system ATP-binding protein
VLHEAKVIIFDEPTASLTPEEKKYFFDLVFNLKARGVSVIFISHALEEALAHSDRITILRDGEKVQSGPTASFDRDTVIRHMVGRTLSGELYRNRRGTGQIRKAGAKVLSVQDISMGNIVRNNSFSIYEGQITGVFGLIGSGRTETFKVVSGIYKRNFLRGGDIELDGKPVRYYVPAPAVKDGILYVTEDRKAEGLALRQSVRDNALLVARAVGAKGRNGVHDLLERVRLSPPRQEQEVRYLSGGNQQKVVLAKWMTMAPRVLLFDEPTRGVDVGAKAAIHDLMRELANDGMAIVMISSELPELIGMSDRVVVLRGGRIAGTLPAGPSEEAIMRLAAGEVAE